MKPNFKLVSFVGLVILAVSISAAPMITERNQQFRVWEDIQAVTNDLGEVSFTTKPR
jgi:hypothetical protein